MADPKTEAERIRGLMHLHRRTAEASENSGNKKRAHGELRHADALERFALPLAREVDRLRADNTSLRSGFAELEASHNRVAEMAMRACDRNDALREQARRAGEIRDARPLVAIVAALVLFVVCGMVLNG